MVKQNKSVPDISKLHNNSSSSILQKLMLWAVIPLLFALAVLLIIAKFADINVVDKAKELTETLPFLNGSKEEAADAETVDLGDRVVTLQAEIQEKEAQLYKLQQELENSNIEIENLVNEQQNLLDQIDTLHREKDESRRKFSEIVSIFEKMSAKSAAPVITNMSDTDAIRILTNLKPDVLAAILEKMEPEQAAKYTSLMSK